jgi:hypothetical protein
MIYDALRDLMEPVIGYEPPAPSAAAPPPPADDSDADDAVWYTRAPPTGSPAPVLHGFDPLYMSGTSDSDDSTSSEEEDAEDAEEGAAPSNDWPTPPGFERSVSVSPRPSISAADLERLERTYATPAHLAWPQGRPEPEPSSIAPPCVLEPTTPVPVPDPVDLSFAGGLASLLEPTIGFSSPLEFSSPVLQASESTLLMLIDTGKQCP